MKEWDSERRSSIDHSTVVLALRDAHSVARGPFARLTKSAPPPFNHAGLLGAILGANAVARAACLCLKTPNSAVSALLDEIHCLCVTCTAEYAARPGCVDAVDSVEGRLTANPAWSLLWTIGTTENAADHPAAVAAGIELLLSLHQRPHRAAALASLQGPDQA